ncbi:MAG: UDP-3-O-(3-hydroxymyristoyl)glucosamine N-acyltransferase [Gammaproteobacteria bacterium]
MSYSLGEIAKHINAELHGNPDCKIQNVAALNKAKTGEISFLANRRYAKQLASTKATAVILKADDLEACPVHSLVLNDPHLGFANVVRLFYPDSVIESGVHSKSDISPSAKIDPTASIGPNVVIGEGTTVDVDVYIGPGCVIGNNIKIGAKTRLITNVVLCDEVIIGERVILHPGVVIGSDGFGIANDNGTWIKIPQIGTVRIGDDVEIGANSSIDRGALDDTVIEDGVKIDNQVQIGHNVHIGAHTAIAGCVGIAGSTTIGKRCMIGGAAGISGHVEITDDVIITAMTGVANSIKESGIYSSGIPAMEARTWRKNIASLRHLFKLNKRIKKLEDKF